MGNNWEKRRENLRIHRDWDIRNFRRKNMAFKLSQRSLDKLDGVHPKLVEVVKKAIEYTDVDFGVIYGVRDLETQKLGVRHRESRQLIRKLKTAVVQ